MTGRLPRWVLLVVLAATACSAHSGAAGALGVVGPHSDGPVPVPAPASPAQSAALSGVPGATPPPSTVYGVAPDGALLPDARFTPGVSDPKVTAAQICKLGYVSSARRFSFGTKYQIFTNYEIPWHQRANYRVDALIPLSLGGLPQHRNLWPVPATGPHGILEKDGLEAKLKAMVCSHRLSLHTAQQAIATNWYTALLKYGTGEPVPLVATASRCTKLGAKAVNKHGERLVCRVLLSGRWGYIKPAPKPKPVKKPNVVKKPAKPAKGARPSASASATPSPTLTTTLPAPTSKPPKGGATAGASLPVGVGLPVPPPGLPGPSG
ncbi:hypothetical protein acdb102_19620 [Acidothermaceae bacterium B102]|nr:hypothetical protein acdb102_19620 [Acidothermaceae bacterium B102]